MRISVGAGCRCCEQLVEDAFIKTHQEAESVERERERDAEGKRLWEIVETMGKSMRKQSRRRRRERESSELSEDRLRWD